jgi:hypothetical protein
MKKEIDESVFKEYNQESCYWAGFLAADGCIDVNNTIRLELSGKDKDHVTKFREFCKSEHLISHNNIRDSYKVGFCSPAIAGDLYYKYAVAVNKTYNLIFPLLPDDASYKAYIRGFFDGDGCITEFFNNRPTATYRVFLTSGSLEFLEDMLQYLKNAEVIHGGSIQKKSANCWHIQLGVKDASSFLTWVYDGAATYLERKYLKYVDLIINKNRATKNELNGDKLARVQTR